MNFCRKHTKIDIGYILKPKQRESWVWSHLPEQSNTTTMLPDLKNKRHTLKKKQISINLEIYLFQWGCPK